MGQRVVRTSSVPDIRKTIATACRKAGVTIQVTPHMLRHTFARATLLASGDIKRVQQAMHHKKLASTEIYTAVDVDNLRELANKTFG